MIPEDKHTRVLAIASGGGHWTQLLRLRPAWEDCDVAYATTDPGYRKDVMGHTSGEPPRFYAVPDANLTQKLRLIHQLLRVIEVMARERPKVVISTGASVGYFALRLGKFMGARTIWVDSIANSAELSLAGQRAGRYADLWLTQWPNLADATEESGSKGPLYRGSVL